MTAIAGVTYTRVPPSTDWVAAGRPTLVGATGLDDFNPGVATGPGVSMANVVSRLSSATGVPNTYPKSDRLYCGVGERPSKHQAHVNGTLYPNDVLPVLSVKEVPNAQAIADLRAMNGPGLYIIHHEPFPTSGAPLGSETAPLPADWAADQYNAYNVILPAVNVDREPQDRWRLAIAFHGFAFKYNPTTGSLTYANEFQSLGGHQAYDLVNIINLPDVVWGVDAYDAGKPATQPLGGEQGPAERMEGAVQFAVRVAGIPRPQVRICYPEFGTYADGNFEEACQWLIDNRGIVVAACAWDHVENSSSLTGRKLAAFAATLEV